MALKEPKSNQKGLKKLPRHVRNKMGYMQSGGTVSGEDLKMMREEISTDKNMELLGIGLGTIGGFDNNEVQRVHKRLKKLQKKKDFDKASGKNTGRTTSDADLKSIRKTTDKIGKQSGGMIGKADMSAKKTSAPKKKKMPQYYKGGGMIKKNKTYAYGGRVAKYKD
tara:strand:+ start:232 stop:729 length:498 start_codon:yes stop_codon:yes gene_type:complete